jgi:hypothetical protein
MFAVDFGYFVTLSYGTFLAAISKITEVAEVACAF